MANKNKTAMYIGTALVTIEIPSATNIKDKRNVVRSLTTRLKKELNLSAAEVGRLDEWDYAEIGLAYVSNEVAHADSVIGKAINWIEDNLTEGNLFDYQTHVVRPF
jgi:uncharacterized protein